MMFLNIIFYSTGNKRSRKPFHMRFFSNEDFLWAILVMLLLVIIANGNRRTAEKVTLAIKLCVCPSYSNRLHSFPTSNIIIIIFTTFQYFFFVFSIFYSIFQYSSNSTRLHLAFRPVISSLLAVSLTIKSAMISKIIEYISVTVFSLFLRLGKLSFTF